MTHTPNARPAWRFSALWRRWLFLFLIFVPSILAASYMSALLPHGGGTLVELTLCIASNGTDRARLMPKGSSCKRRSEAGGQSAPYCPAIRGYHRFCSPCPRLLYKDHA